MGDFTIGVVGDLNLDSSRALPSTQATSSRGKTYGLIWCNFQICKEFRWLEVVIYDSLPMFDCLWYDLIKVCSPHVAKCFYGDYKVGLWLRSMNLMAESMGLKRVVVCVKNLSNLELTLDLFLHAHVGLACFDVSTC